MFQKDITLTAKESNSIILYLSLRVYLIHLSAECFIWHLFTSIHF